METYSRYKLSVEIPILAYARWNDVFSLSSFLSHLSPFDIIDGKLATLSLSVEMPFIG